VVGCKNEMAAQEIRNLYFDIDAPKQLMVVTSAEVVKYALNVFFETKIFFINEIANL